MLASSHFTHERSRFSNNRIGENATLLPLLAKRCAPVNDWLKQLQIFLPCMRLKRSFFCKFARCSMITQFFYLSLGKRSRDRILTVQVHFSGNSTPKLTHLIGQLLCLGFNPVSHTHSPSSGACVFDTSRNFSGISLHCRLTHCGTNPL